MVIFNSKEAERTQQQKLHCDVSSYCERCAVFLWRHRPVWFTGARTRRREKRKGEFDEGRKEWRRKKEAGVDSDSQDISNREEERGRGGLGRDREMKAGIQAGTGRRPSAVCGESVLWQKYFKSKQSYTDTESGSEARLQLPAWITSQWLWNSIAGTLGKEAAGRLEGGRVG